MSTNYLDLEPLLIARLKAQVPSALDVLSAADLAWAEGRTLRTPALQVFYFGDAFDDSADRGRHMEVTQTWAVIVVIRHQQGPSAQRGQAGELISAVIAALQGWEPSKSHGRLARKNAPAPVYGESGYAYFPLYFSCRVLTSGS